MTAEFWGALAGSFLLAVLVNIVTIAFFSGRIVERLDGLKKLMTAEIEEIKRRITRLENLKDQEQGAFAAHGG